ncbi:hypothetical protein OROGR_001899 [Orobanche gracilis]
MGTTLKYSSAYHPQSDGQTEVVNRSVECYLRCFTMHETKQWSRYIPLAQYWFNTCKHNAIGMTPYEALFGRKPTNTPEYITGSSNNAAIDTTLSTRNEILQKIRESMHISQQIMTAQANKHRLDVQFQEGDWVYLKLRSYRQISLRGERSRHKLAPRYFGPFAVVRRIGSVAYELDLPLTSRIHRVFHVSLLRPCFGAPPATPPSLPETSENGDLLTPPAEIVGHRLVNRGGQTISQLLISWIGATDEESTWEDEEIFVADNPHLATRVAEYKKRNEGENVLAADRNEVSAAKDTAQPFIPQTRSQPTGYEPLQDFHGSDFPNGLGDKAHLPGVGIDMPTGPRRPNRLKSAPAWATDYFN